MNALPRVARLPAALVALTAGAFVAGAVVVRAAATLAGDRGPYVVAGLGVAGALALMAWRLPAGPLLAFVASLPVGLAPLPGGIVEVAQAAALGASAAVLVPAALSGRLKAARTPLWGWVVLFVLTAAVATPGAVDVERAFRADVNLVVGAALALAVVVAVRREGGLLALHRTVVVVGGAMCASGLPSARASASHGGAVVEGRAVGVFTQPNELGMFAAVVLALALALLVRPGQLARWRVVSVVAAAAAVAALGLSLSRGAWLGAGAATLTLLAVLPEARAAVARWALPVAVAFAGWSTTQAGGEQIQVVVQRATTIADRQANPYDNRDKIWAEAAREIRTSPVAGYGPSSFPVASSRSSSVATVGAVHAHNLWLTVGAEQGVAAVAAVVGLQVAVLRRARGLRRLPSPEAASYAGALAAGAALVVHGVVDYPQRNPTLFLVSWLVIGLCVAAAAEVDAQRRTVRT